MANMEVLPRLYISFLYEFHCTRDYFECHEILEALWRGKTNPLDKNHLYVGLLQIAVIAYHWRRGNFKGAQKLLPQCIQRIHDHQSLLQEHGIDPLHCLQLLKGIQQDVETLKPYKDFNLPLTPNATNYMQKYCFLKQTQWIQQTDWNDEKLIHRHLYK